VRGGVIPQALLFIALGLALTVAPRSAWAPSLLSLFGTLGALITAPFPPEWLEGVFMGCWTSAIATAASVYFNRRLPLVAAIGLSINAGIWASAAVSLSGSQLDVLKALPCVLIFFPASWVAGRLSPIPIKVVSSWVIAVAVLAATLQLLPVTPGYLPDHME
jgi:hypothetical protein